MVSLQPFQKHFIRSGRPEPTEVYALRGFRALQQEFGIQLTGEGMQLTGEGS